MFSLNVMVIVWLGLLVIVLLAGFTFVIVGFVLSTVNVLFSGFCSGLPARSVMLFVGISME